MSKEKKHTILKAIGVTAAAGVTAYGGFGYYVFRIAFDLKHSSLYSGKKGIKRVTNGLSEKDEWLAHSVRDDEFLDSYDGLKLHALRITNHPDNHNWVIIMHGLGSYSGGMLNYLYEADYRGYNILAPDNRGCGMSEGQFTGLGWCEHYDLISWINYLVNIDPQASIALLGVDLGAAAIMNAVGDYLPDNVKCAVEDSGFSSIKHIVRHVIAKFVKIEGKPFLPAVDFFVKQFLHFSMYDVSTVRQLKQSSTPMLFIHGGEDEVIPESMLFDNFYACQAEKELYMVQDAGFGETSNQPDYFDVVFSFISKYIPEGK